MAGYGNSQGKAYSKPAATRTAAGAAVKKTAIFRTGLFAPTKEGVKSLGSVQLKEEVILPAGSYINLYANDDRKSDSHPVFTVSVTEGKLKSEAAR